MDKQIGGAFLRASFSAFLAFLRAFLSYIYIYIHKIGEKPEKSKKSPEKSKKSAEKSPEKSAAVFFSVFYCKLTFRCTDQIRYSIVLSAAKLSAKPQGKGPCECIADRAFEMLGW